MTAPERRIYEKGMNPHFWRDLPNRQQRNYYRKQFEQIIRKYGGRTRETVGEQITGKVNSLLKSSNVLPAHKKQNLVRFTTSSILVRQTNVDRAVNASNQDQERRCKVCGTSYRSQAEQRGILRKEKM